VWEWSSLPEFSQFHRLGLIPRYKVGLHLPDLSLSLHLPDDESASASARSQSESVKSANLQVQGWLASARSQTQKGRSELASVESVIQK
jgi:hypothetical protein